MTILLDPGHGNNTPGKRSPDGRFLEYRFNREIASRLNARLLQLGYDSRIIVPEQEDIPLAERCRRVNAVCQTLGKENVILISIHANASGNGSQWMSAQGWSAYTSKGQTKADILAECLYDAAAANLPGKRIRTDSSDGDRDWEENFYILRRTICPAVLTENFFYDSKDDLAFLESEEGRQAVVQCHIVGIQLYIKITSSPV